MKKSKLIKKILICASILFFISLIMFNSINPSNERNWSLDQKILPYSESPLIDSNIVKIYNIRNFSYYNASVYSPSYYNFEYDISQIDSVWYIVEPFSQWAGSAHTFLSFGFKNGKYLAVSVEIRKEKGEQFSALKGLFKQYEIMYVLADESDAIKLRSNYRNDSVYVYPVNASKENIELLFRDILARVNKLHEQPEFYNTISNTCTTNIASHVNNINPGKVPFSFAILAPGYSDKFAYGLGLLNVSLPYEEIREKYIVNSRALKYANDSDFSARIRECDSN